MNKAQELLQLVETKINIDQDLEIDYRDSGPWRSYQLTASGSNLEELIKDATISEIDQDGGELNSYAIEDAPNKVASAAMQIIHDKVKE